MALVPISGRALDWAVTESGFTKSEIEDHLKIPHGTVDGWIAEEKQPNQTQFRKLRKRLKRPAAVFFMENPPKTSELSVKMRFGFGAKTRNRTPSERFAIRDALCVQRFMKMVHDDLGDWQIDLPVFSTSENAEVVANLVRTDWLKVSVEEQINWTSPFEAFRQWRNLVEKLGVYVFLYPMGENSARGFSYADRLPPVIGVSTTWAATVRVYTLFHEIGHILTRTDSSCVEECEVITLTTDPVERWCDSFASSFLMPRQYVEKVAADESHSDPLLIASHISKKMSVSRKSALLRLIEIDKATWEDFRKLDVRLEKKTPGGFADPNVKRTRAVMRRVTYGNALSVLNDAYKAGAVSEAEIRSYLNMHPEELSQDGITP